MIRDARSGSVFLKSATIKNIFFDKYEHPKDAIEISYIDACEISNILLNDICDGLRSETALALAGFGGKAPIEGLESLEHKAALSPFDHAHHLIRLGHFFLYKNKYYVECLLHVIKTFPRSPVFELPYGILPPKASNQFYTRAKLHWRHHVEANPTDTIILGNAAHSLFLRDPVLSGEFLRRAKSLEPNRPKWSERLASLYQFEGRRRDPDSRRDWAAMALSELERAREDQADRDHPLVLLNLAEAAYEAGEFVKAALYAEAVVSSHSSSRQSDGTSYEALLVAGPVYRGYLILGELALLAGNVRKASEHLLASVNPALPLLFDEPDFSLARELLEQGEAATVLSYLENCGKAWPNGTVWIESQKKLIKEQFEI